MTEASQSITKKSASNLAMAFVLLPKPKRLGMSALYAFCREVDDIADNESQPVDRRREQLQEWRADIDRACRGKTPSIQVVRELQPYVEARSLPFELFDELIRGVEMDLDITRYETFEDLDLYCYRVASVVGLLSIQIFEHEDPRCRDYAISLGKALQLTNILRDVRNDAERSRVYLPMEALSAAGVTPDEILAGRFSSRYKALAERVAGEALKHYERARDTLPSLDRRRMAPAELMGAVYWRLLQELRRRDYNVFDGPPARLSKGRKLFLIGRTWLRIWRGAVSPNYGGWLAC